MPSDAGNAATFSWGGTTQAKVNSISYSHNGNEIDVTAFGDTAREYLIGIPDLECTVELFGVTSMTVGATGAAAISWGNSATPSTSGIATAVITGVEMGNGVDGAITSSVTVKPYGG